VISVRPDRYRLRSLLTCSSFSASRRVCDFRNLAVQEASGHPVGTNDFERRKLRATTINGARPSCCVRAADPVAARRREGTRNGVQSAGGLADSLAGDRAQKAERADGVCYKSPSGLAARSREATLR
jgi:hypothetical protein